VPTETASWVDIQLTYSVAYVYGGRSQVDKALRAIDALEARLGSDITASMRQRWLLWKADLLMVCGLGDETRRVASEAIGADRPRLESMVFAGPFSRWVAMVFTGTPREGEGREILAELEMHLDEYDALDQFEILCAAAHANRAEAVYRPKILERLNGLPRCSAAQIAALGLFRSGAPI
jgi:hypothetical protein